MDTHVIYIILLLVVTIICIGVSAGVKYDKSDYENTTGHPSHVEYDDGTHETIISDEDKVNQTKSIQLLTPETAEVQGKLASGSEKTTSGDSSTAPTLKIKSFTESKILYTSGEGTHEDLNEETQSKNYLTPYTSSIGGKYLYLEDRVKFKLSSTGYDFSTTDFGSLRGNDLSLKDKMLRDSKNESYYFVYDISNDTFDWKTLYDGKDGDYVYFKIFQGSTTDYVQFRAFTYKTDGNKNLVDLSFFGKTTDFNYPRSFRKTNTFSTGITLNSIEQYTEDGQYAAGVLPKNGMFALTDAIDITFTNTLGFTSSSKAGTDYNINVLDGNKFLDATSPITLHPTITKLPDGLAANSPFYHIHIVFLPTGIDFKVKDGNTIRRSQTVLLVLSEEGKTDYGFDFLSRDNVTGKTLTLNSTTIENDFYENQGNLHYTQMGFFTMCTEEGVVTGDQIWHNPYKSKYGGGFQPWDGHPCIINCEYGAYWGLGKNLYHIDGDDIKRYETKYGGYSEFK